MARSRMRKSRMSRRHLKKNRKSRRKMRKMMGGNADVQTQINSARYAHDTDPSQLGPL